MDILKRNKLLRSDNKGHCLSPKGSNLINNIKKNINIKNIEFKKIFPNKKKTIVHIRNPKKSVKSYILRDEAVKNGADGALILNYDTKLHICDSDYKQDFSKIENEFDLNKNDLVIVAYAHSYRLAEHGALAAAIELNRNLKNVIQKLK